MKITVTKVVDWGKFKAKVNEKEKSIRLIGADTSETVHPNKPVQPYSPEASAYTKKHLEELNRGTNTGVYWHMCG